MPGAPKSWGAWPPDQDRINEVAERAARQLHKQLQEEGWTGAVLVLLPRPIAELDLSFSGQEAEIEIAKVRAIGKHRTFTIYWNPATGAGRIYRNHGYDYRS